MSEVTREDVAYKVSDALAPLLGQQPSGPTGADFAVADALIAAFPHLVGKVEIASVEGGYSAPDGPNGDRPEHWTPRVRTIYTVTGPWRGAER